MSKSSTVSTLLQVASIAATVALALATAPVSAAAILAVLALNVVTAAQTSAYQKQKARHEYNNSLTDRNVMTTAFDGARSRCYGRVRNVDGVVFKGSRGDKSQFYTLVVALCGHEIDGVETVYFNDVALSIDGSNRVTNAPYGTTQRQDRSGIYSGGSYDLGADADTASVSVLSVNGTYNRGATLVYPAVAFTRTGTVVYWDATANPSVQIRWQANATVSKATVRIYTGAPGQDLSGELATRFPSLITSAHKFSGIACLLVDLEYDDTAFTSGVPSISAVFRGARVYDPRTTATAWSQNPALCIRDWSLYAHGGGCASYEIDDAAIIRAANICDTSQTYTDSAGTSSTVPLYRCDYVAKLDVSPETHLAEMVESMAGKWGWAGGQLKVRAGAYSTPVAALDDSWLSSTPGNREIVPDLGMASLTNTYRLTIADQTQNWVSTQLPALAPAAYITADGCELSTEIQMGAVSFGPQALHIGGVLLRDMRDAMTVKWPCNMRAWVLELFDVVTVTSTRYGWSAKAFEVVGWEHQPQTGVMLTLKETAASIYNPDAVFSAVDQVPNTTLTKPWDLPMVTGLAAQSGTDQLIMTDDGTVVSRILLTFDPITSQAVVSAGTIEVQYNAGGGWISESFPGSSASLYIRGVQDGAVYLIKVRVKSRIATGNWCTQITHIVVGKTEPPPTVDSFLISAQPDGTRILTGGYSAANRPLDLAGYRIRYRQGSGPYTWASMTPFQTDSGFFTTLPIETNQLLAGTYTIAIVGVDTSGNESDTPLSIITTLPNPRMGNALAVVSYDGSGWPGTLSQAVIDVDNGAAVLRVADQATWATLPSTWAGWTRWVWEPYTSWTYITPAVDFGAAVTSLPVVSLDCVGAYVIEEQHSTDGTTWSSWATIAAPVRGRYIKLRVTVTATGGTGAGVTQITQLTAMSVIYTGAVTSESGNDISPAALTGGNHIGTGDIRLPLSRTYASISRVSVTLQNVTGNWSYTLIDKSTSGPRVRFYNASGVLADPPLIDYTVEGVAA